MTPRDARPFLVLRRSLGVAALAVCALVPRAGAAETRAFVFTTDFATGSIANAHFGSPPTVTSNLASVWSDAVLRYYNGLLYVVNRSGADNIQVLDPANNFVTVKQFSVGNGSNPHDIMFASPTKAYVTRYDSSDLWIVNPQTGAHTGTISLAAFADADGIPEMDHLALWGGWVFVSIQRLDRNNFYAPVGGSLLAVIDPVLDVLHDVNGDAPGIQGIPLPAQNPVTELQVDPTVGAGGQLVVGCAGSFGVADGAVVRVDPWFLPNAPWTTTTQTEITEATLGGDINAVAMASTQRGYVVVSDASFNTVLRSYDRGTGLVTGTPFSTTGFNISDIEVSDRGELWLCDRTAAAPGLRVFDAASGAQLTAAALGTGLPPQDIAFDALSASSVEPRGGAAAGLELERVAPNPTRGALRVSFTLGPDATGAADLQCYDVSGRVVRRLRRVFSAPGRYDWTWDGRDASGRAPGPGVYFLELRAGGLVQRGRVLVLR